MSNSDDKTKPEPTSEKSVDKAPSKPAEKIPEKGPEKSSGEPEKGAEKEAGKGSATVVDFKPQPSEGSFSAAMSKPESADEPKNKGTARSEVGETASGPPRDKDAEADPTKGNNTEEPSGDSDAEGGKEPGKDLKEAGAKLVGNRGAGKPREIALRDCFGESDRARRLWDFTRRFLEEKSASRLLALTDPSRTIVSPIPELGFACARMHGCANLLVAAKDRSAQFIGDGLGSGTILPALTDRDSDMPLAFWLEGEGPLQKLKSTAEGKQNTAIIPQAPHELRPLADLGRLAGAFVRAAYAEFYGDAGEEEGADGDRALVDKLVRDPGQTVQFWRFIVEGQHDPLAAFRDLDKLDAQFENYLFAENEDFPRECACLFVEGVFPQCDPETFLDLASMLAAHTPSRFIPDDQYKPPTQITDRVLKNCLIQFHPATGECVARPRAPEEPAERRTDGLLAENFIREAPLLTNRYLQLLAGQGLSGHWNEDVARQFARFAIDFKRRLSSPEKESCYPRDFAEQTLLPLLFAPMLAGSAEPKGDSEWVGRLAVLRRVASPARLKELLGPLVKGENALSLSPMVRMVSVLPPEALARSLRGTGYSHELIGRLFWSLALIDDSVRIADFLPFVKAEERGDMPELEAGEEARRRAGAAWPFEYRFPELEAAARDGRLRHLILGMGNDWSKLRSDNGLRSLLLYQIILILLDEGLGDDGLNWRSLAVGMEDKTEEERDGLPAIARALYAEEFLPLVDEQALVRKLELEEWGTSAYNYPAVSERVGLIVLVASKAVFERDEIWQRWPNLRHDLGYSRAFRVFALMAVTAAVDEDGALCFRFSEPMREWLTQKAERPEGSEGPDGPNGMLVMEDLKLVHSELDLLPKLLGDLHREQPFDRALVKTIQNRRLEMKAALLTFRNALRGRKKEAAPDSDTPLRDEGNES